MKKSKRSCAPKVCSNQKKTKNPTDSSATAILVARVSLMPTGPWTWTKWAFAILAIGKAIGTNRQPWQVEKMSIFRLVISRLTTTLAVAVITA